LLLSRPCGRPRRIGRPAFEPEVSYGKTMAHGDLAEGKHAGRFLHQTSQTAHRHSAISASTIDAMTF
jgi:hypothetical protein